MVSGAAAGQGWGSPLFARAWASDLIPALPRQRPTTHRPRPCLDEVRCWERSGSSCSSLPRASGSTTSRPHLPEHGRGAAVLLASLACAALPRVALGCRAQHGHLAGRRGVQSRRWRIATRAARQTRVRISEEISNGSDFYQVLGVNRDATQEEIRHAYKRVIRETHPDMNPSPEATDKFIQAQEAFRWLSDPQQREVYDGVGSKFGEDALYDYTDDPILGALSEIQEITALKTASELVNHCRKQITWKKAVKIDTDIKDLRSRFRKYGAQRVMWVKDYFCAELRRVLEYPRVIKRLHPFERLSVELSLTQHMQKEGVAFGKLLGAIKALRTRIVEEAAARAHAAAKAERGRLATFLADEAIEVLFDLVITHEPVFQQFRSAQRAIFQAPVIDLDKPTVVFIGAPNVGKSSLVRSLSTGRPEVNDYLYTTKQLTIGHLWHFIAGTPLLVHGQIVDSPGLRSPPGGNHNLMDELTMGSMQHLPSAVVFVFDPYPLTHGILSVRDQVELREALRAKFPRRPWLDVITKVDREEEEAQESIEELSRLYPDAVLVSALEGTGLDRLNMEVRRLLEEMTRVVRQLQRSKIRQLRMGAEDGRGFVGKEALTLR